MSRTPAFRAHERTPSGDAACRNCGVRLTGPYCSRCGQKDLPLDPPLRQFLGEWLAEHIALDSRIARTLRTLLARPGRLTLEYNQGRRARYVPPLRLYMVVSVLFFFVLALGPSVVHIQTDEDGEEVAAVEGTDAPRPDGGSANADAPDAAADEESDDGGFWDWVGARAQQAASDPAAFNRFWIRVFAWSMFVAVPIAAAFLMLAFRRPKRGYIRHLVFALHTHSFVFLALSVAIGGSMLLPVDRESAAAVLVPAAAVGSLAYFYLALARVYGDGWIRTAVKALLLGLAYMFAQVIVMVASLLVAFALF